MVAEGNDALMEEFFDKGTLPVEHIVDGLKQGVRELRIFPVLCASGLHNIGTDQILNFIVENLPGAHRARNGQLAEGDAEDRRERALLALRLQDDAPTRSPAGSLFQGVRRGGEERRQRAEPDPQYAASGWRT